VVIGHLPATGRCDTPIIHDPRSSKRMRCTRPGEGGQAAHTEWTVLHHYPISPLGTAGYTHIQVHITTGVRHQIRVHMAHLGYPLVGDPIYQSRRQRICDRLGVPHHLLHAADIGFVSPATGQKTTCVAPLPSHFLLVLKTLDETEKRR
jgi:23S rRNA pseudouridine1911/1915/1917 synthase